MIIVLEIKIYSCIASKIPKFEKYQSYDFMKYSTCCILFLITLFTSCSKNENDSNLSTPSNDFIKGADLSFITQLESLGIKFYNEGAENDVVSILKEHGMNTVRIRLWHTPTDKHSSFAEVVQFANRLKNQNLKVWLCVHYSDTWADPAHQNPPQAWQGLSYEDLKDSLYNYTSKIVTTIQPDYIQIGNEINPGLLLPQGDRFAKPNQFIELLKTGIEAVRNTSTDCKIMIITQVTPMLTHSIMKLTHWILTS